MLDATVTEKSFAIFTNQSKLDEELSKEIEPVVSKGYAQDLGKRFRKTVVDKPYPSCNSAMKELAKLQDNLRDEVKAHGIYRLSDKVLTRLALKIQGKRIKLKARAIAKDDEVFQEFTDNLPEKAQTVLRRGLNGHKMVSIDIEADGQVAPSMILVDLGDYVWIPSFPAELEFENGDKLVKFEAEDLFKPVLDTAVPQYKDRGVVNVKGPRGGDQLVGEVFSMKMRDQIEVKQIELENGYKLELFA